MGRPLGGVRLRRQLKAVPRRCACSSHFGPSAPVHRSAAIGGRWPLATSPLVQAPDGRAQRSAPSAGRALRLQGQVHRPLRQRAPPSRDRGRKPQRALIDAHRERERIAVVEVQRCDECDRESRLAMAGSNESLRSSSRPPPCGLRATEHRMYDAGLGLALLTTLCGQCGQCGLAAQICTKPCTRLSRHGDFALAARLDRHKWVIGWIATIR